jgi:thioredoxin-dependent peroxiredoxin
LLELCNFICLHMKLSILLIFTMSFFATSFSVSQELEVGDVLKDFSLKTDEGKVWNLNTDFKADYLVVYFYPAAMTGGCTAQACAYRDALGEFKDLNTQIIAVSGDEINNLKVFKSEYDLNFPLLSDIKGELAKLFGVPTKDGGTISRKIEGKDIELSREITILRWTFVIDKDRKLVYKAKDVNPSEDSKQILNFITEIN